MTDVTKNRSQSIASIIASTLVALACNGSAGKVMAAQPPERISKVVSYGDLDLDSAQGAKVLYGRLRLAAQEVCRLWESKDLTFLNDWKSCLADSLASAIADINKPTVTALQEKSVRQPADGNS
jgi:UrcA family protein